MKEHAQYTTGTMSKEKISLAEGSGGKEMEDLIKSFQIKNRGIWQDSDNDAATLKINSNQNLVFTTDSFVVDPLFFPGGNIGDLAFCGTVNDICMMGANPFGLSLSLIIEEGFPKEDLKKIMDTINKLSSDWGVPVVTGDTKVMEKGKIDKIIINTSAVAISERLLKDEIEEGDQIILSGGIGEHAVALLSKRFDYKTEIVSDSKPLILEISSIKHDVKQAKDPTRGGIAAVLNELAEKNDVGMMIDEEKIPIKPEVKKVCEMLGINPYELACEGRFVCIVSKENAKQVLRKLKKYNNQASIIGEITQEENKDNNKVILNTFLGKRILPKPKGRIVPRIC